MHPLMSWKSTMIGIQCWNCSFMRILGCTWKYWSMKKNWGELHTRVILLLTSNATKLRPAVLNSILRGTIALCERLHRPTPDAQTRSSDADRDMCLVGTWSGHHAYLFRCVHSMRQDRLLFPEGKNRWMEKLGESWFTQGSSACARLRSLLPRPQIRRLNVRLHRPRKRSRVLTAHAESDTATGVGGPLPELHHDDDIADECKRPSYPVSDPSVPLNLPSGPKSPLPVTQSKPAELVTVA